MSDVQGSSRLGSALRSVTGFFRYGLARFDRGRLRVGDEAPDASLIGLDGRRVQLRSRFGGKSVVLVFGSFT